MYHDADHGSTDQADQSDCGDSWLSRCELSQCGSFNGCYVCVHLCIPFYSNFHEVWREQLQLTKQAHSMLPTRKKARVTRPVTIPTARPVSPSLLLEDQHSSVMAEVPSACPVSLPQTCSEDRRSSGMGDLSDSSSSDADSPPCVVLLTLIY